MGEETQRGQPRPDLADLSSESGWITTEVAARAVRVSPRTIRRYIDQGKLEAKPQGEGVRREWLVSVDSLHALRASRTFGDVGSHPDRADLADESAANAPDSIADVLRDMAARLERRAEEAAELRVRLELTEQTQSTLEDERRRALEELAGERRRREEVEQERDELHHWRAPWWLLALLVVLLFASVSFLVFFMVSFGVPLGGGVLGA
jgi:aminopeptidase N